MGQIALAALKGPQSDHPCRYCLRCKSELHLGHSVTCDEIRSSEVHFQKLSEKTTKNQMEVNISFFIF